MTKRITFKTNRQKIKEVINILWWESHDDDEKLKEIWKILIPNKPYMGRLSEKNEKL